MNLASKVNEMKESKFVVLIHGVVFVFRVLGFRKKIVAFVRDINLNSFIVVTDICPFWILRTDFFMFLLVIIDETASLAKINIDREVMKVEVCIVIEASMELNHGFSGLAGLEDSHRFRTLERVSRCF